MFINFLFVWLLSIKENNYIDDIIFYLYFNLFIIHPIFPHYIHCITLLYKHYDTIF